MRKSFFIVFISFLSNFWEPNMALNLSTTKHNFLFYNNFKKSNINDLILYIYETKILDNSG